jgi:transposase InsO family protein
LALACYRRLRVLLRREGWKVNHKRVYRLEGLRVRTKKRKRRGSHLRIITSPPTRANERWSMDFVQDSLIDARRFRVLAVVDVSTRECLAVHADSSLSGHTVAEVLDGIALERNSPKPIMVDTEPNSTRGRCTPGPSILHSSLKRWGHHVFRFGRGGAGSGHERDAKQGEDFQGRCDRAAASIHHH